MAKAAQRATGGESPLDANANPDAQKQPEVLPGKIKMLRPHGFIDDDGKNHHWHQDQVVFEPADIAILVERGADFEVVKEE